MTTTTATAQLPTVVEPLMKAFRLPHARAIAADVLATARAQRCDPTEVIKALLNEELAGRARSMLASRRKAAGFPTGKTFEVWDPNASSIPLPTQQALQTLEWSDDGTTWWSADRWHRQDVLPRGPGSEGHRGGHAGGVVHPRTDRGAGPGPPRR